MKKEFSTAWKASKQPRKQRKYIANAPIHIKKKFVSVNLSKDLRKKHGKRNIGVRKGDVVKIMRGKFKKKQGKVTEVKMKIGKIFVEGIQAQKQDKSMVNAPLRASNLQIIELNLEDNKRASKLKTEVKKTESKAPEKAEAKEVKKEESSKNPTENKK